MLKLNLFQLTRQPAVLLTVVSFLHSFFQVTQRFASRPEVPQQVSMFLVRDRWTLWTNVDGPRRPVVVSCDCTKKQKKTVSYCFV